MGDIGATPFTSQTAPTTDTYANVIVDGQNVMMMASGDRIISTDGGTTFANGDHGSTGDFNAIGWDGSNGIVVVGYNKSAKYSTDKGKTWQNVGLLDSHHISRIVINPNNSEEDRQE